MRFRDRQGTLHKMCDRILVASWLFFGMSSFIRIQGTFFQKPRQAHRLLRFFRNSERRFCFLRFYVDFSINYRVVKFDFAF